MSKLSDPKSVRRNILLLSTIYMVSYLTRVNFGVVIYEMVLDTGYEKAVLSTAVTGAFITYGAGQLLSGWLGDRMQPKKLVLAGLLLSSVMNLLIPFCPSPPVITAVWCINGLAQALIWPPLVRLMTGLFCEQDYRRCSLCVHWGASLGTMLLFLLSPLLIRIAGWQTVFFFSACSGIAMSTVWLCTCPSAETLPAATRSASSSCTTNLLFMPFMLLIMTAIILVGALRDGITTWMPTYIGETYRLGVATATLTGVALPLFGMGCQRLASMLYRKLNSAPLPTAVILCGLAAVSALLLVFTTGKHAALSAFGAALLTGSMHGANMLLVGFLPSHFSNSGHVSTISGVLNACIYIGSALSTYGFAALSETVGWSGVIVLWLLLAVCCSTALLLAIPGWKRTFSTT